jgi:hypothetical protein
MFFRRESPQAVSFAEHVEALRRAGFETTPAGGGVEVSRGGCAAVVRDSNGAPQIAHRAGMLLGGEIASLVDGGFQKFFRTPSGRSKPALATELRALHDFEEDLKEALGLTSLYNEALGTVSTFYRYDRLQGR